MRGITCVFVCLGIAIASTSADEALKDSVAALRANYAKRSAAILKIVEPVQVSEVFYYKDGGTIGIEILDAGVTRHRFCLDGRSLPTKERPNEKGTRNLYLGAAHPAHAAARKVDILGPEEAALYGVMLRWANRHPQRQALFDDKIDLTRTDFGNLWEIREFFLRLDARFVQK